MNSALTRARRSTLWLLLMLCVGGVLAADKSWVGSLRLGIISASNWFSNAPDSPNTIAVFRDPIDLTSDSRNSMGRLLNQVLFSRPSGSWSLMTTLPGGRNRQIDYVASDSANAPAFIDPNVFNHSSDFGASFTGPKTATAIVKDKDGLSPNTVITSGTGTWAVDSSGTWSDDGNWAGNNVPDGAGTTADLSTVNLTADRTVTLDVSRTIQKLTIGDTDGSHSYTLSASPNATLTFALNPSDQSTGDVGILTQSSTSAGDTISAPIIIGNLNYMSVRNDSTANALTISGGINTNSGFKIVQFEGPGEIDVTGNISNGTAGNVVTVGAVGGLVILSGTNTYTGGTSAINGVTLLINGDSSGANGSVFVGNSGTLGGTGTIGGAVGMGGGGSGGVITGGTVTDVGTFTIGTVTMNQNLTFNPGEGTAKYLANLDGAFSDTLQIHGDLSITGNSHLQFVGSPDGFTTYTLANYMDVSGAFIVDNLPSGYDLIYGDTALLLVPTVVPEPATWIGAALALGAIGAMHRRRKERSEVRCRKSEKGF